MLQAGVKFYIPCIRNRPSLYWKLNKATCSELFRIVLNAKLARLVRLPRLHRPSLDKVRAQGHLSGILFFQVHTVQNYFFATLFAESSKIGL